jgi:hypothetical protein
MHDLNKFSHSHNVTDNEWTELTSVIDMVDDLAQTLNKAASQIKNPVEGQ